MNKLKESTEQALRCLKRSLNCLECAKLYSGNYYIHLETAKAHAQEVIRNIDTAMVRYTVDNSDRVVEILNS